jgi:hypothetical protein
MTEKLELSAKQRAERYRANADEALRAASGTVDHRARYHFLRVAEDWRNLADITERSLHENSAQTAR